MKNIIITGTSNGIGFKLATLLLQQGHNIISLSRQDAHLIRTEHIGSVHINYDLNNPFNFNDITKHIENNWNNTVDIIINNAGYLINKPFKDLSITDFKAVYNTNVFGIVELLQGVLPYLKKNSHVVNISSMGGIQGSVKFPGLSAYSSSKGALITLTEVLAEEYKETGPSFNVLALGAVQTKMLEDAFPDFKAPVSAKDMAQYIANFALTGQQFYNGKVLQVSSTTP